MLHTGALAPVRTQAPLFCLQAGCPARTCPLERSPGDVQLATLGSGAAGTASSSVEYAGARAGKPDHLGAPGGAPHSSRQRCKRAGRDSVQPLPGSGEQKALRWGPGTAEAAETGAAPAGRAHDDRLRRRGAREEGWADASAQLPMPASASDGACIPVSSVCPLIFCLGVDAPVQPARQGQHSCRAAPLVTYQLLAGLRPSSTPRAPGSLLRSSAPGSIGPEIPGGSEIALVPEALGCRGLHGLTEARDGGP